MSVQVPIDQLPDVAGGFGESAYVLAGDGDGAPRVTHARIAFVGGVIETSVGRRAAAALGANPDACVLWPAPAAGEMSLIVDVVARGPVPAEGGVVRFDPIGAVRHRPA
ncbi:MAG: hypothetical protein AAF548_08625 [Actinomycetota bacterium]